MFELKQQILYTTAPIPVSMTNESSTKSGPDKAPDVTKDNRLWMPKECPKCQRLLKTKKGYDKHIKACKKEPSKPRVVLSDEERIARRKAGVQRWVDKNTTIQIRLLKGSSEMNFVDARVAELREQNPEARIGWATYFLSLLSKDMKRHAKKAARK